MSRLLKSRDYLIKCLGFVLLFGFISLGAIGGCSDNNGGGQGSTGATTALTENDFANNATLSANFEQHNLVHFLEHPDSEGHENDTGGIGHDVIPITYKRTLEHTFCWDDDDVESELFMELDDSDGKEILRVYANGECVTKVIEAGDYVMTIWHDGRNERNHAIFIRHGDNGELGARKGETIPGGILERAGSVLSNILAKLDIIIAQETNAQTVEDNRKILITTNACIECDLSGADLSGADLRHKVLTGANLTGAHMEGAHLDNSFLNNATLVGAHLDGATLLFTVLVDADLTGADLTDAKLTGAEMNGPQTILIRAIAVRTDFTNASLSNADLTEANLLEAILIQADLFDVNLSHATWCDGFKCQEGSRGVCETGERFMDNCDGTIIDNDTKLMWEKKDQPTRAYDPHLDTDQDLLNCYTPSHLDDVTCTQDLALEAAFTLSNTCHEDPSVDCEKVGDDACKVCCGFACHRDWHLPQETELKTIIDCTFNPPINPLFVPISTSTQYWTNTTYSIHSNGVVTKISIPFDVDYICPYPTFTGTFAHEATSQRPGGFRVVRGRLPN